jgi:4-amino-4-deoxy-L-arabinose transferase-like glycosyltransferase
VWDERDYDTLATNLARTGEFSYQTGRPISLRPPLYPGFVSLLYRAAGVGNYEVVRLAQAGLSLVTLIVVYAIGRQLYSRRIGVFAAALAGFYPSLLVYNNLILTEVLFTLFLCTGVWLALLARRMQLTGLLTAAGVALGLGALTRSALWPFPVALAAWVGFAWPGPRRQAALGAGMMALAFAVTLAPWTLRNAALERTFQPVDCMGGRNLMMGNYAHTPMFRAWDAIGVTGEKSWHAVLQAADPGAIGVTQGQLDKRAMRYAVRYALAHPVLTLQRDIVKFFNFWGLEREIPAGLSRGMYGDWSRPALLAATFVILAAFALAVLSGVFGALVVPPRDRRDHALVLLIVVYLTAIHTLSFGHSRYHLPLVPLILPYSAAFLASRGWVWSRQQSRGFAVACLIATALVASWCLEVMIVSRSEVVHAVSAVA